MERTRLRSWAEIGARVAYARKLVGLGQRDLADRLGMHPSVVQRVERGTLRLDAAEVARLAESLGWSVEWLLVEPPPAIARRRESPPPPPPPPPAGSGAAARRDRRWDADDALDQVGRDVELLVEVGGLAAPAPPERPDLLDDPEKVAAEVRGWLGAGDGPLLDLASAVERLGLLAFSLHVFSRGMEGSFGRVNGFGVVAIEGGIDAGRRRDALAHALGHHLLGDEYAPHRPYGRRTDREAAIDAFAVELLLPRASVRARWAVTAGDGADRPRRLLDLAAEYRVGWLTATTQARVLDLLRPDELGPSLLRRRPTPGEFAELSTRLGDELAPVTLPAAYREAVLRVTRQGAVGPDRAVELLHGTATVADLPQGGEGARGTGAGSPSVDPSGLVIGAVPGPATGRSADDAAAVLVLDGGPLRRFALAGEVDTLRLLVAGHRCVTTRAVRDWLHGDAAVRPALAGAAGLDWMATVPCDDPDELHRFCHSLRRLGNKARHVREASVLAWAEVHGATVYVDDPVARAVGGALGVDLRDTPGLVAEAMRAGRLAEPRARSLAERLAAAGVDPPGPPA